MLVNQAPGRSQVSLFTPAYGAAVPRGTGTAEVVLEPFPTPVPGNDLASTVVAVGAGGGETIPPDGAVLQAAGTAVAPLKAEAPVGTPVTVRLILQPEWAGVTSRARRRAGARPEPARRSSGRARTSRAPW